MSDYAKNIAVTATPTVDKPIPGERQIKNAAGGFVFEISEAQQLERFLILGTEKGSFYAKAKGLTLDNVERIKALIKTPEGGRYAVQRAVEVSVSGESPSNDTSLCVLALAIKYGDAETRKLAFESISKVARIGTHLFTLMEMMKALGVGWGRAPKRAVSSWYTDKELDKLAYQMVKYQSREKWSHADLLSLSHPKPANDQYSALFQWALKGMETVVEKGNQENLPQFVTAFEAAKAAETVGEVVSLIEQHNLPREAIPTKFLNDVAVWEALLHAGNGMPVTALIRNLGKMTSIGLLKPNTEQTRFVIDRLNDVELLKRGRVHPVQLLSALTTYRSGGGVKGNLSWNTVSTITDALEDSFYASFGVIEPSGQRFMLGIDVSLSMTWNTPVPGVDCRGLAAVMAMVTARVEKEHCFTAFSGQMVPVDIGSKDSLETVVGKLGSIRAGNTNCALPMIYAKQQKIPVDTFVVYTDNETWIPDIHPRDAVRQYREATGINSKLIVVALTAMEGSIADPNDPLMLDVSGFSTATPLVISAFSGLDIS